MVRKMMNTVTIPTEVVVVVSLMVMTMMMNLTLSLDDALLACPFSPASPSCYHVQYFEFKKKNEQLSCTMLDLLN